MKTLEFDAETIGTASSLDEALRAAFAPDVLRYVHGDGVHSIEAWEAQHAPKADKKSAKKNEPHHAMERHYGVRTPIPPTLPPVLRHLAGGSDAEIEMSVRQRAWRSADDAWRVESKFKLHVPCGRMVRVKCYFLIRRDTATGHVSLANSVKARVLLPAPLNQVAEEYVLQMFVNSVANHAEAMRKEMAMSSSNSA